MSARRRGLKRAGSALAAAAAAPAPARVRAAPASREQEEARCTHAYQQALALLAAGDHAAARTRLAELLASPLFAALTPREADTGAATCGDGGDNNDDDDDDFASSAGATKATQAMAEAEATETEASVTPTARTLFFVCHRNLLRIAEGAGDWRAAAAHACAALRADGSEHDERIDMEAADNICAAAGGGIAVSAAL